MVKQFQDIVASRNGAITLLITLATMIFSAGFYTGKLSEKVAVLEKAIESKP